MDEIKTYMSGCTLCPRRCAADRQNGKTGYCGQGGELVVARAALHMWEEPCISGASGSGAVFFAGCNMGCVYCQNGSISKRNGKGYRGESISVGRLADIFVELMEKGANNINLVTPTHYIPHIALAIKTAKEKGLSVPIVYNTGGYERVESLRLLQGLVDIYLPDFKYMDGARAARYSEAADYPQVVKEAIREMYRQVGAVVIDGQTGLMKRGVLVRHLVLPDTNKDSKQILRYLRDEYKDAVLISLLHQYTPISRRLEAYPELDRPVGDIQYDRCVAFAQKLGMANVYIQEGSTAKESFIPDFNGEGVNNG